VGYQFVLGRWTVHAHGTSLVVSTADGRLIALFWTAAVLGGVGLTSVGPEERADFGAWLAGLPDTAVVPVTIASPTGGMGGVVPCSAARQG
jgi:hypothetical protein